ncbi:MAG: glycosyltransferase [Methylotenera sp.]|nr:glycosyltransferase [Methylotenera sp.]MDP1755759.1 glycosyltransferase [Methylotenera sp.]MDP1958381.1 glycosyltransferase [Methylotenera sp.]MDP3303770.1 glycosyltransferase [Methylotenera sp.]MDP3943634.1 glycosyltransferase [Methylotenera sp.]
MKILFISDVYFPRINGVSTSIRTFVEQMQNLGHVVHLIAPDYAISTQDEAWIKRISARSIYFDPEDKLMKYGEVVNRLPELRLENYDIVHVHTPFVAHYLGLKLARELNVPCVETYHTFFEDYLHHYLPWIPKMMARAMARMISKRQCNAVDAIVAPSQPMLEVLRGYGIKVCSDVIPTGLQAHSFKVADGKAFREKYGIAVDRPMLLYVGRVAFEKNISFLLDMTKALIEQRPDVLLVVAGEGPAEASLHKLAKNLRLENNIKFIGYLDRHKELNACYQAADVFVFASKSETQGLVLLEAMAQGTPVVAIAELGTASILIEGQGALIAPDNTAQFAEKVYQLLLNPEERFELGHRAKSYVLAQWTAKLQAERMLKFYSQLKNNQLTVQQEVQVPKAKSTRQQLSV